jgi:DNA-binding transcriptional LysR family regulator
MNLPTDLLRSFVTVAELGGVTSAGDVLGRSQPAVSLQIKRLEDMLSLPLFDRANRRLKLTAAGQKLFDYARQMLALNDEAVANLTRPRISGNVHLGIPNEFAASFLPAILQRYARSHPKVTVQVTCDLSVNLLQRLQQGEFDLALALHDHMAPETSARAWMEDVVWVGAPGATAYRESPLPLIVAPQGCVYRARVIRALDSLGQAWRIAYTSPNFSGIRAGVSAGLGITAVARSTVTEGLKILSLPDRLPRLPDVEMGLHYDRESISAAAYRLVEFITAHVGPMSGQGGVIPVTGDNPGAIVADDV